MCNFFYLILKKTFETAQLFSFSNFLPVFLALMFVINKREKFIITYYVSKEIF